jgi:hypothetical protein
MMKRVACTMSLLLLLGGCATPGPPHDYVAKSNSATVYDTESGKLLRIEQDGTVYDITCVGSWNYVKEPIDALDERCRDGKIEMIGSVTEVEGEWDMSGYDIAPETGCCEPLIPLFGRLEYKRRSCWHRLWEVPTFAVLVPLGIVLFYVTSITGQH